MKIQPLPLRIDLRALETYSCFAEGIPEDFPRKYLSVLDGFKQSLTSKQCNEPYEKLLSQCLGIMNVDTKHGWDGVDRLDNPKEVYEYKPSSNKLSPSGTINDDSIAKIEKCEQLEEGKIRGWMILAGINKEKYTFDCIYKFPLQIYTEDRKKNLASLIEKNKKKEKQTRSIYNIGVGKSIKLCEKFNQEYYVWKRQELNCLI